MTPKQFTEARQRLGLTTRGMAAAIGLARQTITNYEHGRTAIPLYISLALETLERRHDELGDDPLGDHHGRNK